MKTMVLLIFSFLAGEITRGLGENTKCGVAPDHEAVLRINNQNGGYGYDSLLVDLERWGESPYVTIDSLGASVQNRALWELTISDNPLETSSLKRIYIHSRTHPGEEESFWVTNEIINLLISDTPLGEFVRANCVFHIIPMYNPDGVELGYPRENANGVDIESGWDDPVPEPEVVILKNRFIELMSLENPIEVALNMHAAYSCVRYFVYHAPQGTSYQYSLLEKQFIYDVRSYFPGGIEPWDYFVSWTTGTPDQYPESWWWIHHGENVMALTYEDMNCSQAGSYDLTANAIVNGIGDFLGLNYVDISNENDPQPSAFKISPNYPNPFNPATTFHYDLPEDGYIQLDIYDLGGRLIKTLIEREESEGRHSAQWNGTNNNGEIVSAGIYVYSVSYRNHSVFGKMILIK